MDRYRVAALVLAAGLLFAAATDYIPAFVDSEGRVFGLFHLDIYRDALHVASGLCPRWGARRQVHIRAGCYVLDAHPEICKDKAAPNGRCEKGRENVRLIPTE